MNHTIKNRSEANSSEISLFHRKNIYENKLLHRIYNYFFERLFEGIKAEDHVKVLELGSGGSIFKDRFPELITSDIIKLDNVDMVIDAHQINFPDHSIDYIILNNVLHHLEDPLKFFQEANRVLRVGGEIRMIEPHFTPFSALIYQFFHHEPCYWSSDWKLKNYSGERLSDANLRMADLIFIRDKSKFRDLFPRFHLDQLTPIIFFSYLFSGGVNRKFRFPDWLAKIILAFDLLYTPKRLMSLFVFIKIRKL